TINLWARTINSGEPTVWCLVFTRGIASAARSFVATPSRAWSPRSRPRRWTPILHGRDEVRARAAIHDIIADLEIRAANRAGGPVELAELALLLAEAGQLDGMRIDPFRVRSLLDIAAEQRGTGPLLGGATGIAFAAACARLLGETRVPCTER